MLLLVPLDELWNERCFRPRFYIRGQETIWANGVKFCKNHVPGAGSIARPVDLQSSVLRLCRDFIVNYKALHAVLSFRSRQHGHNTPRTTKTKIFSFQTNTRPGMCWRFNKIKHLNKTFASTFVCKFTHLSHIYPHWFLTHTDTCRQPTKYRCFHNHAPPVAQTIDQLLVL